MLKYTTTKEASKLNGIKLLVYGDSFVGKTFLCSTAPKPLVISAESMLRSLQDFDIPVIEIETVKDLQKAYTLISEKKKFRQFKTICLDSLSEIAEVILSTEKLTVKDKRQAYSELLEQTLSIIKKFRDMKNKNIYFAAKQIEIKDPITGIGTFLPSMPGQRLGPQLKYYFDEVFNLQIVRKNGKQKRRLLTRATSTHPHPHDRSNNLEKYEKPNLTYIFNKIMGVTK